MNRILIMFFAVLTLSFGMSLSGCGESQTVAKAPSGTYIGQQNEGIDEFLGIRYGNMEPFKAATDVKTTAEDEIKATSFGYNCIQPYD